MQALIKARWSVVAILILGLCYIGLRTHWYATYPPTQNYDHFNTLTMLNVLLDPTLYPTDPIWQDGGQVRAMGFLFTGYLRFMNWAWGGYLEGWTATYFWHLLLYLPGAYLLFHQLTGRRNWLAALMALISSMPFYLYFSYSSWGITPPYATVFTTVQLPWLLLAFMALLRAESPRWGLWAGFALWLGSTVFWNPVNGLFLVQMFCFALLVEWLAGRVSKATFVLVVAICGALVLYYTVSTSGSSLSSGDQPHLMIDETQAVIDSWVAFSGLHFFPWAATRQIALAAVWASTIGGGLLLLIAPFLQTQTLRRSWLFGLIVLMCQLPIPMMMTRDSSFLLLAGYWVYRYQRLDRWDILWLSLFTASNLGGVVQDALAFYLFSEHKVLSMASLAFESFRGARWAFFFLFVGVGRWIADISGSKPNIISLWGAVLLLGASLTRIGHVGLDDTVVVRVDDTLRLYLPIAAMLIVFVGRSPFLRRDWSAWGVVQKLAVTLPIGIIVFSLAYAMLNTLNHPLPFSGDELRHVEFVLALLLIGLGLFAYEQRREWGRGLLIAPLLIAFVFIPLSSYHRPHGNYNASADYLAAAAWAREHSAKEALFLPLLPLDAMPFRAHSQRSVIAWDVLQTYYFVGPREMLATNDLFLEIWLLNAEQPEAFDTLLNPLGVDYVVVESNFGDLPYPLVFESENIRIYQMNAP